MLKHKKYRVVSILENIDKTLFKIQNETLKIEAIYDKKNIADIWVSTEYAEKWLNMGWHIPLANCYYYDNYFVVPKT
tara:strand:+ start:378 stop:608 length:231 start_codon:yes stop_codon:yes gene_type:complete